MTLHGTVQNGVVVLCEGAQLPEGTSVDVVVGTPPTNPPAQGERMSEEERRRILAIMDAIAALPCENTGDTFSGADHDKVLYRKP